MWFNTTPKDIYCERWFTSVAINGQSFSQVVYKAAVTFWLQQQLHVLKLQQHIHVMVTHTNSSQVKVLEVSDVKV